MTEEKVFDLQNLLTQLENKGGYFLDFLKVRNLEAGIIVLHPEQEDTQEPHSADELYYIIEGTGSMELGKMIISVKKGSMVFVPARLPHKFYGNKEDLVVLYMFAE
jgi:mannose-6-phosphate isomerase-like protein (cupin superfamily)